MQFTKIENYVDKNSICNVAKYIKKLYQYYKEINEFKYTNLYFKNEFDESTFVHDYDKFVGEKYGMYLILLNDDVIGMFMEEDICDDIIIDHNVDIYEFIYNLLNFYSGKFIKSFVFNFEILSNNNEIFKKILTEFGFIKCNNKYTVSRYYPDQYNINDNYYYYIFEDRSIPKKIKYDNNIEIIIYSDYTKKNILYNFRRNFMIVEKFVKKYILLDIPIDFTLGGDSTYNEYNLELDIYVDIKINNILIDTDRQDNIKLNRLTTQCYGNNGLEIIKEICLKNKTTAEKKINEMLDKLKLSKYKKINNKFRKIKKNIDRIGKNVTYNDIIVEQSNNNNLSNEHKNNTEGYLYLIKYPDINPKLNKYKFGMTSRENPFDRIKEHGHDNELIMIQKVNDIKLKKYIKNIIKNDKNIKIANGQEYYYCEDECYLRTLILNNICKKKYDI